MQSPTMMRSFFTRVPSHSSRPATGPPCRLRVIARLIFVYYGADKLFLGSANTGMDAEFFRALGIPFPRTEPGDDRDARKFFGGLALIGGFLTKIFALLPDDEHARPRP